MKTRIELIQDLKEKELLIKRLLSEITILRGLVKDEHELSARIALQMKKEREHQNETKILFQI